MRKLFPLLLAVAFFWNAPAAASDLTFVDANGSTGYYVDEGSVSRPDEDTVAARIAVIKANTKRVFYYDLVFDQKNHTYQILSSEVQKYDTGEVTERQTIPMPPRPFGINSPMNEILQFIITQGGHGE